MRRAACTLLCAGLALGGCDRFGGNGGFSTSTPEATKVAIDGAVQSFAGETLAILTPTAGFGQEENRQAIAKQFGGLMTELRPDLKTVELPRALSDINAAGLAESYDRMYTSYRSTGLFDRGQLQNIGAAIGARYLVQLKLQGFDQQNKTRFSYLGVSILQSQTSRIRLFLQVWDSRDGRIVWEDSNEATKQVESVRDRQIGLDASMKAVASDLIRRLPQGGAPAAETQAVARAGS